ncbi:efflux RND transporter periplasmic adaptor subunit [Estrella lausannensis]|uniref:RND family transporter, membrane fusion protein n=1 Tax=Estrella lausannensis TaxID=483423 RepID=A0A0H5DP01_9BACT|nr:efflux RND transporter periplasmic adaptor subunit [Estrella lausannensis]CRX37588.1 RND family transporter, membrane fusion protein [Estrella lausannensis]
MSPKIVLSYGLAALVGAATTLLIIYSRNVDEFNTLVGFSPSSGEERAISHEHMHHDHDEDHHHDHDEEENLVSFTEEQLEKLKIQVKRAGPGTLQSLITARGKIIIQPDRLAHIIPKISGIARQASMNIGDKVKADEVIAVLESREMADTKAAYLTALSKEKLTASALERETRLYKERISAGQDFLSSKNAYEESLLNLQLAAEKLQAFGLDREEISLLTKQDEPQLRLYHIRSPIDGTIILRHITKGEFIENTTTIYEVADLSHVWVEIGIYPKDLYRVKEGQRVDIVIPFENKGAKARLIYVSPIIDEDTITATAIAELDNADGLFRPGVFVKVNIPSEERPFPITVPKSAVQSGEGKEFVFVAKPEGFERRIVETGESDQDMVEIKSGLLPGEEYAATNTFLLKAELGKDSAEHEH